MGFGNNYRENRNDLDGIALLKYELIIIYLYRLNYMLTMST